MNEQEHMEMPEGDLPPDDRLAIAISLVGDAYAAENNAEDVAELSEEEREKLLGEVRERFGQEWIQPKGKTVAFWPNALMVASAAVVVFAFVNYYDWENPMTTPNQTTRKPIMVAPHLPPEIPAAPVRSPAPTAPPTEITNQKDLTVINPKDDEASANFIRQGNDLFAKGDYEKAIDYFEQALDAQLKAHGQLELHPDVAYVYSRIGETYKAKGEYEKAIGFMEKSLAIFFKVHGR